MNFEKYFYKNIGKRIKSLRNKKQLRQTEIDIDVSLLSKIENGKVDKNRNPYLLSAEKIDILCRQFNIDSVTLIWGTKSEQENFIKLLLLTILMSANRVREKDISKTGIPIKPWTEDTLNPFCFFNFDKDDTEAKRLLDWASKQKEIPEELRRSIQKAIYIIENKSEIPETYMEVIPKNYVEETCKEVDSFFIKKYPFFYNKENFINYNILFSSTDNSLQKISDSLFNQLIQNFKFIERYTTHVNTFLFNIEQGTKKFDIEIDDFLKHPSAFSEIALDFKEYDYYLFVSAFNQMWEKHSAKYMSFFTDRLFNADIFKSGLKKLKNSDLENIIKSEEFLKLCNDIPIIDYYREPEAILAHNYYLLSIQSIIQQNYYISTYPEKTDNRILFELLSDSCYEIKKCAENIIE